VSDIPSKHVKIRGRDYGVWGMDYYPLNPSLYRSRSAADIFLGLASTFAEAPVLRSSSTAEGGSEDRSPPLSRLCGTESSPLAHSVGYLRTSFYAKDQASLTRDGLLKEYPTDALTIFDYIDLPRVFKKINEEKRKGWPITTNPSDTFNRLVKKESYPQKRTMNLFLPHVCWIYGVVCISSITT
jgi:hypothetical protein